MICECTEISCQHTSNDLGCAHTARYRVRILNTTEFLCNFCYKHATNQLGFSIVEVLDSIGE